MTDRSSRPTRRGVLKRSGAALLAAGTAGVAGCVETLPPLGQQVRFGRVDVPDPEPPAYRRWAPAPSALPDGFETEPHYVQRATPGKLGEDVVGHANRAPHSFQKVQLDYFGVGYENYDEVIGLHGLWSTFVLRGSLDPAAVGATLTDTGYAPAGSHAGYDLYDRGNGRRTAAVSDEAVVWANRERSRAVVEAVVDAGRGAVPRYHETDDAFALVTDRAGASPWTWIGAPGFVTPEPEVATTSYAFDDRAVYFVNHLVYRAGRTPSKAALQRQLEESNLAMDAWAVDVRVDGRVASVEMRMEHGPAREHLTVGAWPQITWGVEVEDGTATVRHEAGEATPAETVTLYRNPESGGRSETSAQFADEYETVEPGDALAVDLAESTASLVGKYSPTNSQNAAVFHLYERP